MQLTLWKHRELPGGTPVGELAGQVPCETLFVRAIEEPQELYPAEEVAACSRHRFDIGILQAGLTATSERSA